MYQHLTGILIFGAGFLLFARGIVRRAEGQQFSPLPVFLLLLAGLLAQAFMPSENLFAGLARLLLDFGIGMVAGALLLWFRGERPFLLAVPGVLASLLGAGVYGFQFLVSLIMGNAAPDRPQARLWVELGPDDHPQEIAALVRRYDASMRQAFPGISLREDQDLAQVYLVTVDAARKEPLLMQLRHDPENVDHAEEDMALGIEPIPAQLLPQAPGAFRANDPLLGQQWYASSLSYDRVHELLAARKPLRKARVAIVDTGVDAGHEDLAPVYQPSKGPGDQDRHSHGTHCAGLAGAATDNGLGVGSLNWKGAYIEITGFPALDGQGRGTLVSVAEAIIAAAQADADVISLSLGGPSFFGPPKSISDAIRYALRRKAIVVVAAGNSNADATGFSPANIKGVIVVSAVDEQLNKAAFSNTNTRLERPIAAPGVGIMSSIPGSHYQAYNGTSMATPIVSGLVGILRSLDPDISAQQAYELLRETGREVRDSDKVGRVIQPAAAVERLLGSSAN